jgi:hypothetical protein
MSAAVFLQQSLRIIVGIVMAALALRAIIRAIRQRKTSRWSSVSRGPTPSRKGSDDFERSLRLSVSSRFRQEKVLRRMKTIASDIAAWERERQGYGMPSARGRRWEGFGDPGVAAFLESDPFSLDLAQRRTRRRWRDPAFLERLAEVVAVFEERMSSQSKHREETRE